MIDANLTILSKALCFSDITTSPASNPKLRHFDWSRAIENVSVSNPRAVPVSVLPGQEVTVFNGSRTLGSDPTTQYTISLSSLNSNSYRLTWTAGTAPVFRTDRSLILSGVAVTVALNGNATVTMTIPSLPVTFASVQAGDTIFIPGLSTGDAAGPFSTMNEGNWTVLTSAAQSLTLMRPEGTDFQAVAETATLTAHSQLQAFAADGVQVGDTLDLIAGFSVASRKTYAISSVNAKWVEFFSSTPLALEADVAPGTAGLAIYSSAVRFLRVESTQECALRFNADTASNFRVSPIPSIGWGWAEKFGSTWGLKIVNLSGTRLDALVISAE